MTRFLKSRVAKLEASKEPSPLPESNVVYFDPLTDEILSPRPKNKPILLVPQWPSEEAWETALLEQQARLIASAQ